MKKQGFTLIELMVVIVIMGILAAVAVPKLFGMIAKSKASEIGPAAGEYIKLQDAYVSETGLYVGTWSTIGYTMNGETPAFKYEDVLSVPQNKVSTDIPTTAGKAWKATAKVGLNECDKGSTWVLYLSTGANGNGLTWGAGVKDATSGEAAVLDMDDACSVLTPQFVNFRTQSGS
ncbi:prepilin-type N-terminal cleavage/methylation domain-containing protein [Fibrobacter sp. UWT2]|uniref:type IV pilin protein n=1 Tax=Fibrobacter sp. UWT2 TaxID=1896224 RepID=UPI000916FD7B|nr:prepilin-type N-terminal cleavage/methylation domain-containing protein [Fibrobacter sp. UWT2]SHL56220.1 prepilin-type N-terminal cleavage/methylation domain-containing protein [Fibrobacter sp. UWT2]